MKDPRRFRVCRTCNDFGMVEQERQEDVCPTCEGGIWRERESWRLWIQRQTFLGFRLEVLHHRVPRIYRDFPA